MSYNFHHVVNKFVVLSVILTLFYCALYPGCVGAQGDGMSITITPPLFQLSLQPGESWSSTVSVVNNNKYDLSLYANPVQFRPSGESGLPVFVSNVIGNGPTTSLDDTNLAGWITVPEGAFFAGREKTYSLPISIHVPDDATPGGHYAAILVGNNAPESVTQEGAVNVSSSIAILIFLTVSGDVVESGRIREFSTRKSVYETAEAYFTLRFENQGNVHLLPQGNITIYNMFGKKRGMIPVNQNGAYGNVLPESTRSYNFTWKSDAGLWDIGRYKAEATIGYGKDGRQSALSTMYFYVLPIVPLLQVLGGALFLLFFVMWTLKRYIRRALALEAQRLHREDPQQTPHSKNGVSEEKNRVRLRTLVEPIKEGFVDLRGGHSGTQTADQATEDKISFLRKYKRFFAFLFLTLVAWFVLTLYLRDVMTENREYDVTQMRVDGSFEPVQLR